MKLIHEVPRLIGEMGEATADDLARHLPDVTRKQILKAINNATTRGLIECVRYLPRERRYPQGVFVVVGADVKSRAVVFHGSLHVNSIFQLGDRAAGASA